LHISTTHALRACPHLLDVTLQVWVPYATAEGDLPEGLSDAAFDELAATAASRAAATRKQQQQPYSPPDW
jgi:hypothetical protein